MALHKRTNFPNPKPEKASYVRDLPAGATHTELGGTLRQSVIDPVAETIAAHAHVRGGDIAADSAIKDQLREVSDEMITPSYGMRMRNKKAGSYDILPAKGTATSAVDPVRKP